MKTIPLSNCSRHWTWQVWFASLVSAICAICLICGPNLFGAQESEHNGIQVEGPPTDQPRVNFKRIIIWPRQEDVDNSEGLVSAISQYLTDHAGWFVAPPELAVEIASRTESSVPSFEPIDPDTGEVETQQPQSSLLKAIAQQTRSDAVLEVRILKVRATVHDYVASWDDMTERVASRKSRVLSSLVIEGGKGWVSAATADMYLWNPAGKLLWKKRRGFAVLGVKPAMGTKFSERPLTEVYQDSHWMQSWLEGTLGELVPPAGTAPVAQPGLSPELREQVEKAKPPPDEQK